MKSLLQAVEVAASPEITERLANRDTDRVRRALARRRKGPSDLALLLSPGADALMEEMAASAHLITLERFGKTMQLYAPLYVSNRCVGRCPYCGFSAGNAITRRGLTHEEIVREAAMLREAGMQSILLVAGDDPCHVDVPFLSRAIEAVMALVPSVSLEVAPLPLEGYAALARAGADGITLYQETYDRPLYEQLHTQGPKSDYVYRLEALARAGEADFCKLTVGALWGLAPWREEAIKLGLHAAFLAKTYWKSHISIGLPRLRCVPDDFTIPSPLSDRAFVHIIVALRNYLPDAGLVLSTRETPELRDRLLPLGITQMSAGSRTHPGGYALEAESGEQFEVADDRTPAEMAAVLARAGYEPVWKNWDRTFVTGG
jgi:2-iminoacetate synthase